MAIKYRCASVGLISTLAIVLVLAAAVRSARASATGIELQPAEFNILNPETEHVIGYVRYSVGPVDDSGLQTVHGDERYLDGEHDVEKDVLQNRGPGMIPTMVTFEHDFYASDGSISRVTIANFRTGDASCTVYKEHHPDTLRETLDFPDDTYAGAVVELPIARALRDGSQGTIHFYAFNCVPGPKIFKVEADPNPQGTWRHYDGPTVEVSVKPDFGWLNLIVAPFLPEFSAWFNPSEKWQFVGARFSRFYKGPEIILTQAKSSGKSAPAATPSPPQLQQSSQPAPPSISSEGSQPQSGQDSSTAP